MFIYFDLQMDIYRALSDWLLVFLLALWTAIENCLSLISWSGLSCGVCHTFMTTVWTPPVNLNAQHKIILVACERQTFLLAHRRWGMFCKEERLWLSDRNSILMTWINVYTINPVIMGFQMQICSILHFSWSILVKCCVHLRMSSSKTQMLLLEKTIFHKYWLFC